jgi:murein DD-endopeptidase MepM/ murein hydrolase activator NlpD
VIGYVGVQAVSRYRTGTHLHLGVYDDVEKKYIDPEKDDDLKKIVDKYPVYTA